MLGKPTVATVPPSFTPRLAATRTQQKDPRTCLLRARGGIGSPQMNPKQLSLNRAVLTNKSVTTITPQDATEALEYVLSRAQQVFAYLHYRMLVHNKDPKAEADALIVLKNAALESSLMSIRDLDLFFVSKRHWDDDIIASDYGFVPKHRPLDKTQRKSINKKLAHITCHAGRELRLDPTKRNPRTWKYADLVERTMKPVLDFMDHLNSSRFPMDANLRDLLDATHSTVLVNLQKLAALSKEELNGVKE